MPILYWTLRLTYKRVCTSLSFLRARSRSLKDHASDLQPASIVIHHSLNSRYSTTSQTQFVSNSVVPETTTTPVPSQTRTKISLLSYLSSSKPLHVLLPCCFAASPVSSHSSVSSLSTTRPVGNSFELQSTLTTSTTNPDSSTISTQLTTNRVLQAQRDSLSSNSSSNSRKFRKRSSATSSSNGANNNINIRKSVTYQQRASTGSTSSDRGSIIIGGNSHHHSSSVSSSISHLTKSHVLTASKELQSVTICSWLFVLAYTPKLLNSLCKSCFHPSRIIYDPNEALQANYTPPTPEPVIIARDRLTSLDISAGFYLTFLDECAICIAIPFVLLFYHSKLRFSIIMCLACCLSACRLPFRQMKLTRVLSSRANSFRGHSRKSSSLNRKRHRASSNSSSSGTANGRHRTNSSSTATSSFRMSGNSNANQRNCPAQAKKMIPNFITNSKSILKMSNSTDHNVMAAILSNSSNAERAHSANNTKITDQTSGNSLSRSSSLRINYPSSNHHSFANHALHYQNAITHRQHQSDRNISVTII